MCFVAWVADMALLGMRWHPFEIDDVAVEVLTKLEDRDLGGSSIEELGAVAGMFDKRDYFEGLLRLFPGGLRVRKQFVEDERKFLRLSEEQRSMFKLPANERFLLIWREQSHQHTSSLVALEPEDLDSGKIEAEES